MLRFIQFELVCVCSTHCVVEKLLWLLLFLCNFSVGKHRISIQYKYAFTQFRVGLRCFFCFCLVQLASEFINEMIVGDEITYVDRKFIRTTGGKYCHTTQNWHFYYNAKSFQPITTE